MWIDDGCLDKSDSPPTVASHDHLPLDVWPPSYQEVSGEAGDFDALAVGCDHTHGDAAGCVEADADAFGSDDHAHSDADDRADAHISRIDAGAETDGDGGAGADTDGAGADGDGDGAGDGGDIKRGHWRHSCTLYYHHGNLGPSHFSIHHMEWHISKNLNFDHVLLTTYSWQSRTISFFNS